jgi:hypothetical protein
MATLARVVSPNDQATTAKPKNARVTMVLASPLKPSMMLIALATPPTANEVKTTDMNVYLSNQSIPQTSTLLSE